jgi:hypothetical protein
MANVTQLTDTVGQFLDSAEFPDLIEPGLAVPALIPLRRMTIQRFMEAGPEARFDLCEGIRGLVAAVVAKATDLLFVVVAPGTSYCPLCGWGRCVPARVVGVTGLFCLDGILSIFCAVF